MKLGAGTLLSPAAGEWLEVPCLPALGPVVDTVDDQLVPHLLDFVIIRYATDGAVLEKIDTHVAGEPKVKTWPFTAIALADVGILAGLTNGNRVVEFAADGKIRGGR